MRGAAPLAIALAVASCATQAPTTLPVHLIPVPQSIEVNPGVLTLAVDVRVVAPDAGAAVAELLAAVLRRSTGYDVPVTSEPARDGDIALVLDPAAAELGDEGYDLAVAARVVIRARTPAGLFYGCQTLRQLLPPEVESATVVDSVGWDVPFVDIRDVPRFAWRGAMLDVARHFFGVDDVKRFIDLLAYHKLNRLHLHLTDDQGWRIEIQSWPRLATVGGASAVGGGAGGYYTQAEYAELVAYAQARFITVVPEIDMPGHINAALSAYGELNEDGQPTEPYTGTQVGFSSLWLDGEITYEFVDDVIRELAAITPGPYIHIGGDEANATDADDYRAFIARVQDIVASHGKIMIGWEEVGSADVATPTVAQYWRDRAKAIAAANRGASIIASPAFHAYLDMKYDLQTPIGITWAGFTDVDKAYDWDPAIDGIDEAQILGVEAPLWTETVQTRADIDLLAFPRLAGHAEIAWSPRDGRSWHEYRERLAHHARRLTALGVGFYRSAAVDWPDD